jgi:hypothetical protein
MSFTSFNWLTELRKAQLGKQTKASKESLLYLAAEYVLSHKK